MNSNWWVVWVVWDKWFLTSQTTTTKPTSWPCFAAGKSENKSRHIRYFEAKQDFIYLTNIFGQTVRSSCLCALYNNSTITGWRVDWRHKACCDPHRPGQMEWRFHLLQLNQHQTGNQDRGENMGGLLCPATSTVHGGFKGKSVFFKEVWTEWRSTFWFFTGFWSSNLPLSQMH